jgi:hypothetical protein
MRAPPAGLVLLVVLGSCLLPGAPAAPAAAADDAPEKLRDQVLDAAGNDGLRLKAAQALARKNPEMLGGALLELGEKTKNAVNLPFLVSYDVQEETRHLRYMATYAAWMSAPDKAAGAFLDKSAAEDEKVAIRAIEAAGLVAGVQRDKAAWDRLLELAKGKQVTAGIEAARALDRAMDPRLLEKLKEAGCAAADNHVRKHIVWAVLDLIGNDRTAAKAFEQMHGRPGDLGKNADECVSILGDKQAVPFAWKADVLKDAASWWKGGRPKDLKCDTTMKDKAMKDRIQGWFDEMKKVTPAWESYAVSVLQHIGFRSEKSFEIFDLKKKTLMVDSTEIAQCDNNWKGSYVLARDAGIAMCALLGEPSRDHRGWEPAYVDLHSFMKANKQSAGKLQDWIDEQIAKKPWP